MWGRTLGNKPTPMQSVAIPVVQGNNTAHGEDDAGDRGGAGRGRLRFGQGFRAVAGGGGEREWTRKFWGIAGNEFDGARFIRR